MPTDQTLRLKRGYSVVFTVDEYYDGPRTGIANLRGKPHFYDCVWDKKKKNYSDLYQLTPISQETFDLAMKAWKIWRKWELAYHSGKVAWKSHPDLQADTTEYKKLTTRLGESLKTDPGKCITCKASFSLLGDLNLPKGVRRDLQVKWSPVKRRNPIRTSRQEAVS